MQLLLQGSAGGLLNGVLGLVLLMGIAVLGVFSFYFNLWIRAALAGANIKIKDLIQMTLRKVSAKTIVSAKITAGQAGLGEDTGVTSQNLQAHYLAGGNVPLVVHAMVAARKAQTISLDWQLATAIDLAGRNILEAVQTSVYPKVIDCPARDSGKKALDAVAKNGIQLKVRTRVTVRANLDQLIGGATEETIIARVGEGIVSAIGSAESHAEVLENPDMISKTVLSRRLDSQTAFEIVSIDIADIDVGQNIGARLRADQAEADTRVARAQAEGKRANAVAIEQEKMASIEESRAKVAEAQAEVPKAMAEAFQKGRMGVMEYYRLQNIQADTAMREAISIPPESPAESSA